MTFRWTEFWKPPCVAVVLILCALPQVRAAVEGAPEEMQQKSVWVKEQLLAGRPQCPFSFVYGGKASAELLAAWPKIVETKKLDGVRVQHRLTWTDPESGLKICCEAIEYADFPAVDWVLRFTNTGDKDTPIIEQIRPLDFRLKSRGKQGFVIHHSLGDSNSGQSFAPVDDVLTAAKRGPLVLAPVGGRSSDGHMPYFNVDWRSGGIAAGIGWSGQWEARFEVGHDGDLRFRAGQQLTHLKLHPGETIRTPRILFVFWSGQGGSKGDSPIFAETKIGTVPETKIGTVAGDATIGTVAGGDSIRGNNLFRRVMMAHYMPRREGELVLPPICAAVASVDKDGNYEKPHVRGAKTLAERGIEVLWSDMDPQQWYPKGFPEGTGTWEPDPVKYPNGLKPVGDAARAAGLGYLLWFEPERVHPGSKIDREHPEYVMKSKGEWSQLFRLHDEKARKWLTDYIDVQITAGQVTWLRWDFNVGPLGFWQRNDEPDRQGMTEIRHVEGLYAMWDDLRERHPGLMIDNCASGGRRIDIETCSRSIPLWHSDMQCAETKPAADQLQNGGLFRWVPLHGCGNVALEPSYLFRSAMTAGNILVASSLTGQPADTAPATVEATKKTVAVYKKLRPYMIGDFYPLLPHDESESQWYGYQFDNPEFGGGCAVLFRREKCPDASKTIRLNGVKPGASYDVTDLDVGTSAKISGKELLEKGLIIEIKSQPGATLIIYRRAK